MTISLSQLLSHSSQEALYYAMGQEARHRASFQRNVSCNPGLSGDAAGPVKQATRWLLIPNHWMVAFW
jgi:hypothetical protein